MNGGSGRAGGSGRPSSSNSNAGSLAGVRSARFQRGFDLLRSDLETVWKLETVSTINHVSYKETRILRRTVPKVFAALTSNNKVSFNSGDITVEGLLQARTTLEEGSGIGDTTVTVQGFNERELDRRKEEEQRAYEDSGRPCTNSSSCH